jgi:hypothetical protein
MSARGWNGNLPLITSMLEAERKKKTGRQRVTLREITRYRSRWIENREVEVTAVQQVQPAA